VRQRPEARREGRRLLVGEEAGENGGRRWEARKRIPASMTG